MTGRGRFTGLQIAEDRGFADSPLEGAGFEPPVPRPATLLSRNRGRAFSRGDWLSLTQLLPCVALRCEEGKAWKVARSHPQPN
jgi:hypothetical protein